MLILTLLKYKIHSKVWDEIIIPISRHQRLHRWHLGMDKWWQVAIHNGSNYLSMLVLQLSMIAKGAPDGIVLNYGSPNNTNDDWKVEHVFSYFTVLSIIPYQLYEPDDAF